MTPSLGPMVRPEVKEQDQENSVRILALDIGTKRVGVAVSDGLGLTAQSLTVVDRQPNDKFFNKIKELLTTHECDRLVVGLPRRMDGTLGPEAQRVLDLVRRFKEAFQIEVETWDERLSTAAVERVLIQGDVSRKKRKTVVDKVAAAYILQGYLDFLGSRSERTND